MKTEKTTLPTNFAFYGTLRSGQGNYRWSVARDNGAEFDGEHVIPGYKMYSLGGYPFVAPSNDADASIVVELYKLSDPDIIRSIHRMEIGAGYDTATIEVNDQQYTLYYQHNNNYGYTEVPNGDWVKFVEARRKQYETKE